jgi:hypothetical protein
MPVKKPRGNNYLLVVSGCIKSAPFLTRWQSLKDHIRKNVGHAGYTHVSSTSDAQIYRGWCHFASEDHAKAAYSMSHSGATESSH